MNSFASAGPAPGRIQVVGAGAIGLYLGGRLAAAGVPVRFAARPRIAATLQNDGLTVIDLDGRMTRLAARRFEIGDSVDAGAEGDLVLLTVKGTATSAAASGLKQALPAGATVVSFQNGIDNPERIAAAAPSLVVIAGMVPFNVVHSEACVVQQTTGGVLAVADGTVMRRWAPAFAAAGLPLALHDDMRAVQWGKLLLNLNNPLNALAGVPLLQQLHDRRWRELLATLQDEALRALRAAGIRTIAATPLPNRWLPTLLRLPTPLFRMLAGRMMTIHPEARLSMHADRMAGRTTEIDDLCGAVARLAQAHGLDAPANRAVQRLIESTPPDRCFDPAELQSLLAPAPHD